jgi:hypothetical protein
LLILEKLIERKYETRVEGLKIYGKSKRCIFCLVDVKESQDTGISTASSRSAKYSERN